MSRRPHVTSVRRALIAVFFVSLCVLSACSGDPESGSIEADGGGGSSDATAPVQPPESADDPTPQGAVNFVKHWSQMLTHASNTGDTKSWLALSEADCAACIGLANALDDLYADGGSMTTDGWTVLSARATLRPAGASGGQVSGAVVRLRVNRTPEAVRKTADSQAKIFRGGKQRYAVHLIRDEDSWSVRAFN